MRHAATIQVKGDNISKEQSFDCQLLQHSYNNSGVCSSPSIIKPKIYSSHHMMSQTLKYETLIDGFHDYLEMSKVAGSCKLLNKIQFL